MAQSPINHPIWSHCCWCPIIAIIGTFSIIYWICWLLSGTNHASLHLFILLPILKGISKGEVQSQQRQKFFCLQKCIKGLNWAKDRPLPILGFIKVYQTDNRHTNECTHIPSYLSLLKILNFTTDLATFASYTRSLPFVI